jgi:hypothetical protein
MHNHKGFAKEVLQLQKTLKKAREEQNEIIAEIERLKFVLGSEEYDDIESAAREISIDVQLHRTKLKKLVLKRLDLNDKLFETTKQAKILEGKMLVEEANGVEKEKRFWAEELRKYLGILEQKRGSYDKSGELKQQIEQKERLRIALHSLFMDLTEKIKYVQNKVYEERNSGFAISPAHSNNLSLISSEAFISKSMQFSPQSCSMWSSTPKIEKHYNLIIPSEIEIKNLIPRSHLEYVVKVEEDTFELYGQQFKFLRDFEGNTFVMPSSHDSKFRNQVGKLCQ